MAETPFRTVPDTNILLASRLHAGPDSPNAEYFERWRRDQFAVLYSWDTLHDIAFLLCADNGTATHLITYDRHLRDIRDYYPFKVCGPTDFLKDLRRALSALKKRG